MVTTVFYTCLYHLKRKRDSDRDCPLGHPERVPPSSKSLTTGTFRLMPSRTFMFRLRKPRTWSGIFHSRRKYINRSLNFVSLQKEKLNINLTKPLSSSVYTHIIVSSINPLLCKSTRVCQMFWSKQNKF